jgi:hypothetical protein
MWVPHRRLHVRVPHRLLDFEDREVANGDARKAVSQIVKAHCAQASAAERSLEATSQGRPIEEAPVSSREDKIVFTDELVPKRQASEGRATCGTIGTVRALPDLGVDRCPYV